MKQHILHNKQVVYSCIQDINRALENGTYTAETLQTYMAHDSESYATEPFSHAPQKGIEEHMTQFWHTLSYSFPDLEIQPYLLFGDVYKDMECVCCAGNMIGTFARDWFTVPATQQATWIRFHAHYILQNGRIQKAWYFIDSLAIMRQAGLQLLPQRGAEIVTAAPMTQDGIILYDTSEEESIASLNLVNAMLDGLLSYDGNSLDSMGQERFWDTKNMMWYGPSGIGTTRGLKGFQKYHQIPFLTAFPDRGILSKTETPYTAQLAEGNYVCDFGFPSMYASHTGDGWLGLTASNTKITLRVVDIWRREENRLVENWVMIDILDILKQFGYDIFSLIEKEISMRKKRGY